MHRGPAKMMVKAYGEAPRGSNILEEDLLAVHLHGVPLSLGISILLSSGGV
jgi:hypothetical protein